MVFVKNLDPGAQKLWVGILPLSLEVYGLDKLLKLPMPHLPHTPLKIILPMSKTLVKIK